MPELPEVETIVRDLKKKISGSVFTDAWTDSPKLIKEPKSFKSFKKEIRGKKINNIWRRAKNIIFDLSGNKFLAVHQKMTGHLLVGSWNLRPSGSWESKIKGPMEDPVNKYIRLMFFLDSGKMLALSDLRKFAKIEILNQKELEKKFNSLGPEPLEKSFNFQKLKSILKNTRGKIKKVLMDQGAIAGIGNIYSDEILWEAKINPSKTTSQLKDGEIKKIYKAIKIILKKAIEYKGDSVSDYRLVSGEKGKYQEIQKVYRQEGTPCRRKDGGIIGKITINGRTGHFCPKCQAL